TAHDPWRPASMCSMICMLTTIRREGARHATIHAGGVEGHAALVGARRAEAWRAPGPFPRANQEPRAAVVSDDAARKGSHYPPTRGQSVLLQGRDPIAVGVPDDARRAGRRLLRRLAPGPGDEHHQVG